MEDDTGTRTALDSAVEYARYGLTIFPVLIDDGADGNKGPMPGYGWVALASNKINEVVEDFDRAIQLWGEDRVGVGWALGLDDFVAIDLDLPHSEWPDWAAAISEVAALNITKRGTHLIFRNPPGMTPGNTDTKFPTSGWGEVRGKHGYIIIAGPDRPGLHLPEFDHCQPFPHPEWLEPYGGGADAVSVQEVVQFAADHNDLGSMPNKINGIQAACDGWDRSLAGHPSKGRHPFAVWLMTCVAEESLAGFYPFADGLQIVKRWWHTVTPPERHKREWNGIVTWAVGRALVKHPPTVESVETEPHDSTDDGITLLDESFLPVDLSGVLDGTYLPPTPSVLKRDDRQALLYRGQVNGIHGDSGLGKGWVALFAAAEQLIAGSTVMMLDLEDVASSIIGRLRLLAVNDQAIAERFIYIRPSAAFDAHAVEHLVALVQERTPALVIIDSLGEAFGLEGIDENHDAEVGPWLRRVPRRLADAADAAVLIVDHVTKVNDNPLHPSGSKRKRAAVGGAQYWIQAPDPLSAEKGGRLRLVCAKDRHGTYARNEHVADLVIRIDPLAWTASLYSPLPLNDSVTARLERAVMKAVTTLAEHGKPCSRNALALMMGGRRNESFEAIKLAVEAGAMIDGKHLRLPAWGASEQGYTQAPVEEPRYAGITPNRFPVPTSSQDDGNHLSRDDVNAPEPVPKTVPVVPTPEGWEPESGTTLSNDVHNPDEGESHDE